MHEDCNLQVAAVRLAHDTGKPVQHPILDRVRSCSSHPHDAVSFFQSLFCPVPEQRLLPHQAQSHPYLKLVVGTMRHDQARRGIHIVSKAEADEEVVLPHGFDSDEAWGVAPVGSANSSGFRGKVNAPTFHNRSKQLRRSKRHWWHTAQKRGAYGAAVDLSCDAGQQIGHASQSKAHVKQQLCRSRTFKPSAKDSPHHSEKGAQQATGAVLGPLAPVKRKVSSHAGSGQADAALQHTSTMAASSISIAAVSSMQQLAVANSQTIAASAAQADGVPVPVDGVHAAVGHAADESQLLQPVECSWQQSDQGEGATSTRASVQASEDTSNVTMSSNLVLSRARQGETCDNNASSRVPGSLGTCSA